MFASKDFFQATTAPSGYQLTRSLRFRASASAYLNRTFGTPTDGKKWTYSCWFKRGVMGTNLLLYDGGASGDTNNTFYIQIYPVSTEIITMVQNTGGVTDFVANTSALFRDPSSWYHFVFIYKFPKKLKTKLTLLGQNHMVQLRLHILSIQKLEA